MFLIVVVIFFINSYFITTTFSNTYDEIVEDKFDKIGQEFEVYNSTSAETIKQELIQIGGYLQVYNTSTRKYSYLTIDGFKDNPPLVNRNNNFDQVQTEKKIYLLNDEQYEIVLFASNLQSKVLVESIIDGSIKYLVVGVIFSCIISYILTISFTKPLYKLSEKAKAIANLNFESDIFLERSDELGELDKDLDIVRKNLSHTLSELNDEMEVVIKQEKSRRLHMATISHELKTPLMVLKGQTECMLENIGKYSDRDKYLKENIIIIDKMDSMVRDILFSARIDDPDFVLNKEHVSINEIIESEIIVLSDLALQNEIEIDYFNEGVLNIDGDYKLINMCIKNILENAIKYNDDKFIEILVNNKEIVVRNIYNDFPDNKLKIQKLFEPFARLDSARNTDDGGHGLGLYTVKRILQIHNMKYDFHLLDGYVTFEIKK